MQINTIRNIKITLFFIATLLFALATSLTAAGGLASAQANQKNSAALLIYSSQRTYSHAIVATSQDAKCGSKTGTFVIGLKKSKPSKLKCTAGASYVVYYVKAGQSPKKIKAANQLGTLKNVTTVLPANQCVFIHHYGITRTAAVQTDGKCNGENNPGEDAIRAQDKVTPVLTFEKQPGKKKTKSLRAVVYAKHPQGQPLSKNECKSNLTVALSDRVETKKNAFKFDKKTNNCKATYTFKKQYQGAATAGFVANNFLNQGQSNTLTLTADDYVVAKKTNKSTSSAANATAGKPTIEASVTKLGPLTVRVDYVIKGINCSDYKATHTWARYTNGKYVKGGAYKAGNGKSYAVSGNIAAGSSATYCTRTVTMSASKYFNGKKNSIEDKLVVKSGKHTVTKTSGQTAVGN